MSCPATIKIGDTSWRCELDLHHDVFTDRRKYQAHHVATTEITDEVSHASIVVKWVRPPEHTEVPKGTADW